MQGYGVSENFMKREGTGMKTEISDYGKELT